MPSVNMKSNGCDRQDVLVRGGFYFSSMQQLTESLESHCFNTATELCRVERVAPTIADATDARAFQGPMTAAWSYYVDTNFLPELRALTPSYPFSAALELEHGLAVITSKLVSHFAKMEAQLPEMWGGRAPTADEAEKLTTCFEAEWNTAITNMLRLWTNAPAWY